MRLLLDTNVLLWAASSDRRLSPDARALIEDRANDVWFSVVAVWEVAIKHAQGRPEFRVEPGAFRNGLLSNEYRELTVLGRHCLGLADLPPIHRDPFDRMILAQARSEGLTLLTSDAVLARYGDPVRVA